MLRRYTAIAILLGTLSAPALSHSDEKSEPTLFGLVIGSNSTGDGSKAPLRYADDDAVQNALLLRQLGAQVVLLANPDKQTRELHPDMVATHPTLAALDAAVSRLNGAMDLARKNGQSPTLYIFYSGHGDVEHNKGYVHLQDGKLWRADLARILTESSAVRNHVIIDACKSYFMVFSRGAGGSRKPVEKALALENESLPEDTGVLLSTSSARESHEWEAFQSGIFSHEVRSALRGAADANLDGAISYTEAAAFVWTANSAISNSKFRPQLFARPPSIDGEEEAILAHTGAARGDRLVLGPGISSHAYVEDAQGLRLADLHPRSNQTVVLLLPSSRPIFVKHPSESTEVEIPAGSRVSYDSLASKPMTVRTRGAEHVAFGLLFKTPFSPDSLQLYANNPDDEYAMVDTPSDLKWLRRSFGILSILSLAAGGTMTGLASREKNAVTGGTSGLDRQETNETIRTYNAAAIACYAVGGAALLTYLGWTLWPDKRDDEDVDVQLMAAPGGLELKVEF